MCVSRRLLWVGAYRRLALARQSGDPVKAGLTFVAEEEDDDDEEQDRSKHTVLETEGTGADNDADAANAADAEEGEEILLGLIWFVGGGGRVNHCSAAFLPEDMFTCTYMNISTSWSILYLWIFYRNYQDRPETRTKRGFLLELNGVILTGFKVSFSELNLHNPILFGTVGLV